MIKSFYSTMYLGHGASGSQSMFTIPVGQPMAIMTGPQDYCSQCGRHGGITQTSEHTNMCRAGMIGEEVVLTAMNARTSDGSKPQLSYEVHAAGQMVVGGPIWELADQKLLPDIRVHILDRFEVRIAVPPGERLERPEITVARTERVRRFQPLFFGLGRERMSVETVTAKTRPPLFLRVEFWVKS